MDARARAEVGALCEDAPFAPEHALVADCLSGANHSYHLFAGDTTQPGVVAASSIREHFHGDAHVHSASNDQAV